MKRVIVVVFLVLLVLLLMTTWALACLEIHVKASTLVDHECDNSEWHFVINQIEEESKASKAPESIEVFWDDGTSTVVPLQKFTGGVAHYVTAENLYAGAVVDAVTTIYYSWEGEFNLSHGPCKATAVTVTSFTAEPSNDGVLLRAVTAQETETLGFNFYSSETNYFDVVQAVKLNSDLIPASAPGSLQGAKYQFFAPGESVGHFFWLEEVDFSGQRSIYGPARPVSGIAPKIKFKIFLPFVNKGG